MTDESRVDHGRVIVEVDGAVAHVQLNRPDKLNALDIAMFEGLVSAGKRIACDEGVNAVVVSGAGRAFCAGLDFGQFARIAGGVDGGTVNPLMAEERIGGAKALGQQAVLIWSEVPVPVIAAIDGVAYGGGLQIALGADIRVASPDAELSVMEVQWGLIPDMAGTQLLPELVGRDAAKDLTFTGRKVSGSTAANLGLVTRLADDPVNAALTLAGEMACHGRTPLRHAKALLNSAGRVPLEAGLDAEQTAMAELLASPVVAASVKARLEKFGRN
ncbi:crotonase/enoyl-CoA hydratase family protein [Mycobacterium sp. smrl_JER01]|uniref:crotonase/enoyl-CoA hydratase family protein n=1 Tax=Mycobacterium sp. smrl_JER01 TaxID=3402633 RepID=UPI003ACE97A9